MPWVLQFARGSDPGVRLAATRAAEVLARPDDTPALVSLVAAAATVVEREASEAALESLCRRGREACLQPVLDTLSDATAPARLVLLRALATIGGPRALHALCHTSQDSAGELAAEALRLVSEWPEPAAKDCLLKAAEQTSDPVRQVVALRGLIRLASDPEHFDVALLRRSWQLARRPEEKRLVLGGLSGLASVETLALAAEALPDLTVADEAAYAVVQIAERLPQLPKDARQAVITARQQTQSPELRARAEKVLEGNSPGR